MQKVIIVDLDKSLIKIDLFHESLIRSSIMSPINFLVAIFILLSGNICKAKNFIAKKIKINPQNIPYNIEVLNYLEIKKREGFKIILSTGASYIYANSISGYLKIFDEVIATSEISNNVGKNKLTKIKEKIKTEFIYIGDSHKDIEIWNFCKYAIIVGDKIKSKIIEQNGVEVLKVFHRNNNIYKSFFYQLRVHQWVKNFLVFIPIIAGFHIFNFGILIQSLYLIATFCIISSSIYIINDILDLDNDRAHFEKKNRMIASGNLSIIISFITSILLLALGVIFAFYLDTLFFYIVVCYILLNIFYSYILKKIIFIDLLCLTLFFNLRVISAHTIDEVDFSIWLISFSFFIFLGLSVIKRYVDLINLKNQIILSMAGRSYKENNIIHLKILIITCTLISCTILSIYIFLDQVKNIYSSPEILILLIPLLVIWIKRLWTVATSGKMNSDPIIFVIKDYASYIFGITFISTILAAKLI